MELITIGDFLIKNRNFKSITYQIGRFSLWIFAFMSMSRHSHSIRNFFKIIFNRIREAKNLFEYSDSFGIEISIECTACWRYSTILYWYNPQFNFEFEFKQRSFQFHLFEGDEVSSVDIVRNRCSSGNFVITIQIFECLFLIDTFASGLLLLPLSYSCFATHSFRIFVL